MIRRVIWCARTSAGFSLIEVLVALLLLGVGLMGLARLQLVLLAGAADTVAYDHAVRLANGRVESLRLIRLADGMPVSGADELPVQGLLFQRAWIVVCPPAQPCHATVSVQWRAPRASAEGDLYKLSLVAYLAPASSAAQGWLVQSGPPYREILP